MYAPGQNNSASDLMARSSSTGTSINIQSTAGGPSSSANTLAKKRKKSESIDLQSNARKKKFT